LFDSISANEINDKENINENLKSEPVISEDTKKIEEVQNLDITPEDKTEFDASDEELDQEFNQETDEELLDIPTFLRRQAN